MDTDVVVILVGKFYYLTTLNSNIDIWVALGSRRNFSYWHINTICHKAYGVRKDRWHCFFFHSFTGCDITSAFFRRGKHLAWEAWNSFPDVSTAFNVVALRPFTHYYAASVTSRYLERFTVVLYSRSSNIAGVNEARMDLI